MKVKHMTVNIYDFNLIMLNALLLQWSSTMNMLRWINIS